MAYNVTLSQLVDQLRAECGMSTNSGQGLNQLPRLQQTLRRTQARLWQEYEWPHMISFKDKPLVVGERYYTFDPSVDFTRIYETHVFYNTSWTPVEYEIGPMLYNINNSDTDNRSDPVRRWQHYETGQFEVWPIPSTNQTLRFRCIRNLRPLIANSDQADLDDTLIVLFAAAEILTSLKAADAQVKKDLATSHYRTLRGNELKQDMVIMGGGLRRQELNSRYPRDFVIHVQGT